MNICAIAAPASVAKIKFTVVVELALSRRMKVRVVNISPVGRRAARERKKANPPTRSPFSPLSVWGRGVSSSLWSIMPAIRVSAQNTPSCEGW